MDQDAQPAGRHRKPVPPGVAAPETGGTAVPTAPAQWRTGRSAGSAPTREAELARFLAAAREQAAPAVPRTRRARGSRGVPVLGRSRGGRGSVAQVCLLGLLALLVLWVVHTSGRSPAAAGGGPAVAALVATPSQQPTVPAVAAAPARRAASGPVTTGSATTPPDPGRTAPTATRRVPVVPVIPVVPVPVVPDVMPPSWPDVVGELFGARSAAFARGRPELLLAADAAHSPVLAADRRLFATTVQSAGYQRVEGLVFDLSAIRTVSETAAVARLEVTGRQRASRLVGPSGTRVVPAGPVRTVLLELLRTPGGTDWRIQESTAVR